MDSTQIQLISKQLQIPNKRVENVIQLFSDGATIPFIARYRKEATGSLDEVQIADIQQQMLKLQEIEKRKTTILKAIEEQGKLTDGLKARIEGSYDLNELEDIYLPYKKKRKTKGSVAKEQGLEPLAKVIFYQNNSDPDQLAEKFLTNEVPNIDAALQGARYIIAEWLNEDEAIRNRTRREFKRGAQLTSKVARGKAEEGAKYKDYFEYTESLKKAPSHRILAIRRGEEEGFLRVSIAPDEEEALYQLERIALKGDNACTDQVQTALEDAYKRLIAPSIETEFRKASKERADEEAIQVFAENLRQLLLAAPLGPKRTLGLDPGFRTGCKVVVLNQQGDLLHNSTIYPHPPQNQFAEATAKLDKLVKQFEIEAIAVGNGTAGRETMALLKAAPFARSVEVFMVSESGASIYSASATAREEFPEFDATVRGAVSIGRRLMDPLAELVKIDPKSIGVGQYQHDVNQSRLRESLERTVESCVNKVGVNLNTASKHLLTYISGLGPTLAQNIVNYRAENGAFPHRKSLLKVPRMGAKAYEQCAGFLRIPNSKNPLDNTAVHPESYPIVAQMAKDLNCTVEDLIHRSDLRQQIDLKRYQTEQVGLPTLKDILEELAKPGLDPRGEAKAFEFASHIQTIQDLEIGMRLPGIITNITNFGAFVDIGIKENGLVHVSQMADRFVKNPADVVALHQEVQVRIVSIDMDRKRIQLSMKSQ